ncbi:hypothetical protein K3495_g9862 [Podosphaera aphanis]|nr:hypothetical protein K3495_g9862 [Podosphaera aphanis]
MGKGRCWTVLWYTKEWATTVTPVLRSSDGTIAVTIEEKEDMIRKASFSIPPVDNQEFPAPSPGATYEDVTEKLVRQAFYHQCVKNSPDPDRINFGALQLLWKWESSRIVKLAQQCVRQGYHPYAWRTAKGILLRKPNKVDYTQVKSYRVINLLNCLCKVAEKVVAELLSDWCEMNGVLHQGQMGSRKQRSSIDAVA